MDKLTDELKNKKVIFFAIIVGIVFIIIVFFIYILSNKKEKPKILIAPKEEKSALESLSEPIIDSSGKPITENYLQYLPQLSPAIPPLDSKEKDKKTSDIKISEPPVDYLKYLPEAVK